MKVARRFGLMLTFLLLLLTVPCSLALSEDEGKIWNDYLDNLPICAQRGVSKWSRLVPNTVKGLDKWESQEPHSKVPRIYESLGPGQYKEAVVAELVKRGIVFGTRIEATMFFGYDYQNEATNYNLPRHGWVTNHMWRINVGWYFRMPELIAATALRRDGTFFQEYTWRYSHRNIGDPNHPLFREMRAKYLSEVITGKKSYPTEKYPLWEYKVPGVKPNEERTNNPYVAFGKLNAVWYDNPSCPASYAPYSVLLWREHFKKRFGAAIIDPAASKNYWVRREWLRWWNERYADYFKWNYDLIQKLGKSVGKDRILVGANVSSPDYARGSTQLYILRVGALDQAGPAETHARFSHGHFAPVFKTALAVSKGKAASIYRPRPYSIGEALATQGQVVRGIRFANFFEDLFHNCQPGGKVALLYNLRHSLEEPENVYMAGICNKLMRLGVPYEVISELHLTVPCLKNFETVILQNTELNEAERTALKTYVEGGGHVLAIGAVVEEVEYAERTYDPENPYETGFDTCITKTFGRPEWQDCKVKTGKGSFQYIAAPVPGEKQLEGAVEEMGTGDYRLISPRGGVLMNVLVQPKTGETLVGLVNYGREVLKDLRLKVPASLGDKAAWISADLEVAKPLDAADGTVTVPQLGSYALVLFAPKAEQLQKRIARAVSAGKITNVVKAPRNPERTSESVNLKKLAIQPEQLKAGELLFQVRTGNGMESIIFCCDIVGGPRPQKTGDPWRLRFRFTEGRGSGYGGTYYENIKLLFVNCDTGYFESVPVPFEKYEYRDLMKSPPDTNERTVEWRPAKPGKYQMFVQYRFINPWSQGYANIEGVSDYGGTHAYGNRGKKFHWGPSPFDYLRNPIRPKLTVHDKVYGAIVTVR